MLDQVVVLVVHQVFVVVVVEKMLWQGFELSCVVMEVDVVDVVDVVDEVVVESEIEIEVAV